MAVEVSFMGYPGVEDTGGEVTLRLGTQQVVVMVERTADMRVLCAMLAEQRRQAYEQGAQDVKAAVVAALRSKR